MILCAVQSLGKKARKAKSWLKQLSTSSEEMDLTDHDMIYFGLEKRIRKTHILVLQDIFQDTYARFDTIKCMYEDMEDRIYQHHRLRVLRKRKEYEKYGLVPNYEELRTDPSYSDLRQRVEKMNSEDAVNLFLEGKKKPKRCRSKHDEVEESMKDVWKLFVELNELVDNSDNQILRISNQMSNTENYVSSGNEHLEMAIHLKKSADKKKAILMTVGLSTVGFGFIFALSYIVILL